MFTPSGVCWGWALSLDGAFVLVLLFAAPFALRAVMERPMPAVEAGLIGLLAVLIAMGGCKSLVHPGILP
jgi:hypothetical protein